MREVKTIQDQCTQLHVTKKKKCQCLAASRGSKVETGL